MAKSSVYNIFVSTKEKEYILYNTFSKAVIAIDEELKRVIEDVEVTKLSPEKVHCLLNEGILVEDDIDERKILKTKLDAAKWTSASIQSTFTIIPTYDCNLVCPYCYVGSGRRVTEWMDDKTAEISIKFIKNTLRKFKSERVLLPFYGGEPLLNIEIVFKFLKELKPWCDREGIEFRTNYVTNGTLITSEIVEEILNYNTTFIQVVLDGPMNIHDKRRCYKNGKGSYNDVINAIATLKDHSFLPQIRINVDRETYDHVEELLDDLKTRGFQNCRIAIGVIYKLSEACVSYPFCFPEEEYSKLEKGMKKLLIKKGFRTVLDLYPNFPAVCGFVMDGSYIIDPSQDVYKCLNHIGLKNRKVGKISEEGEFEECFHYYDWMSRDPFLIAKCINCKILPECKGGCPAQAFRKYKTYHAPACSPKLSDIKRRILLYLEIKHPDKFSNGQIIWKDT
ncbi:MAG: radical SAM protein [Candidatus Bathyarchaeia archaeon]